MLGENLFEKIVDKLDSAIILLYEKWSIALVITIVFLIGFAIGIIAVNFETPIKETTSGENNRFDMITASIISPASKDVDSPHDWIKDNQIHVYNDRVILDLKDAEWAEFTDTNSMDPVIDIGANAIEIIPKSYKDVHVGDIISYNTKYSSGTIIHRVIQIDDDDAGWYAIAKGDNNKKQDPEKIRFNQIQRIVVAVIY